MTELTSEAPVWHHSSKTGHPRREPSQLWCLAHNAPFGGGLLRTGHTDENKGKWEGGKRGSPAWKEVVKRKTKSDRWWGSGFQAFPDGTDKQTECECTAALSQQPWASRAWMNTCKAFLESPSCLTPTPTHQSHCFSGWILCDYLFSKQLHTGLELDQGYQNLKYLKSIF